MPEGSFPFYKNHLFKDHNVIDCMSYSDELIEKGRSLSDREARKEVYSELNQIIYENCTQLFICHPLTVEACTKYVEGFVSNKDGYNRLWTVKCLQS